VRRLDTRRLRIGALELQQPSLDDVFLTLTGRTARAEEEPGDQRREQEAA
jgi:hypothetical protein